MAEPRQLSKRIEIEILKYLSDPHRKSVPVTQLRGIKWGLEELGMEVSTVDLALLAKTWEKRGWGKLIIRGPRDPISFKWRGNMKEIAAKSLKEDFSPEDLRPNKPSTGAGATSDQDSRSKSMIFILPTGREIRLALPPNPTPDEVSSLVKYLNKTIR